MTKKKAGKKPKKPKAKEPEAKKPVEKKPAEKMPFPEAAVVRIMRANMDSEKMIKKDVKIAMNKWLGKLCAEVAKRMNKHPYVTMHIHEFKDAIQVFENLEKFGKEKDRILAHLKAIRKDVDLLREDLGDIETEGSEMEK